MATVVDFEEAVQRIEEPPKQEQPADDRWKPDDDNLALQRHESAM